MDYILSFFQYPGVEELISDLGARSAEGYLSQFFGPLIPEVFFTLFLVYRITDVAFQLGRGSSKKALARNSLLAFRLIFIILLFRYSLQIFFSQSFHGLFNEYFRANSYVSIAKIRTRFSGRVILVRSEKYVENHTRHLLEYALIRALAIFQKAAH